MGRRSTRRAAATRSVPYVDYDNDDDDEEDEGDWDEDAVLDDEDDDLLDDDDENVEMTPPPFFQGHLQKDDQGQLLYQDDERSFIFRSTKPMEDSWSLQNPSTTDDNAKPIALEWIHPPQPSSRGTFNLTICKQASDSVENDDLQQKLLKAQESNDSGSPDGKMPASPQARLKGGDDDQGKPKASNLKEPPSYSMKEPPATDVKAAKKQPLSSEEVSGPSMDIVYSVVGREVANGENGSGIVEFRGVFRPPTDPKTSKLCLICSVKVVSDTKSSATTPTAAGAKAPPAAASSSSAVAVARKRSRGMYVADDDDDDDVDDNADQGVEYNELIGLHEDASLTPEQLRAKYYGGGDNDGKPGSISKRQKSMEDDDSDSDVGF